jgi:hypothetical protein
MPTRLQIKESPPELHSAELSSLFTQKFYKAHTELSLNAITAPMGIKVCLDAQEGSNP